jgi:hypothetical protein
MSFGVFNVVERVERKNFSKLNKTLGVAKSELINFEMNVFCSKENQIRWLHKEECQILTHF